MLENYLKIGPIWSDPLDGTEDQLVVHLAADGPAFEVFSGGKYLPLSTYLEMRPVQSEVNRVLAEALT